MPNKYHKIKGTETIGTIAGMYGVSPQSLLKANPGMINPTAGAYLRVPSVSGYAGRAATLRPAAGLPITTAGPQPRPTISSTAVETDVVQPPTFNTGNVRGLGGFNYPQPQYESSIGRQDTMARERIRATTSMRYREAGFSAGASIGMPGLRTDTGAPVFELSPLDMAGVDPVVAAENGYVQTTSGKFVWVGIQAGRTWAASQKTPQSTAPAKGQPGYGQSKSGKTGRTRDTRPGRARMEAASRETSVTAPAAPTDQAVSNYGTSNSIWRIG